MTRTSQSESLQRRPIPARYWWGCIIMFALSLAMVAGIVIGGMIIGSAQSFPVAPANPAVPVTITWRPSEIGKGRVLTVANHSDRHLHGLTITMNAPNGEETSRTISTLAPHAEIEIGWLEMSPWVIESGETATFSHPDFQPVVYQVP
jgi:hypothetical protein